MKTQRSIFLGDIMLKTRTGEKAVLSKSGAPVAGDSLGTRLLSAVLHLWESVHPGATGNDIGLFMIEVPRAFSARCLALRGVVRAARVGTRS